MSPEPFVYTLHWAQSVSPAAPVAAGPPGHAGQQRWLVLADRRGIGDAVAARLADRGDRVVVAHPERDVAEALTEAAGDAPELVGVVLLSALDSLPAGADVEPPLGDAVARQCGRAVDAVRALVTSAWREVPRLWIVTRGAQAVDPVPAPIAIEQASLGGLGRAIALEYPQLRCVRIDLDPATDAVSAAADSVCAELDRGYDGEDEVALRRGMRHLRRLRRRPPPGGSRQLFAALRERLRGARLTATAASAPRVGEVEIAVAAAGVNFRDVLLATGVDGNGSPGFECAGTVTRVGEGVDGLAAGDAVMALASGAFAPFVTARAALVLPLPGGFDFVDAATVPVAFLTAWYGLYRLAHVAPGERVLIHSAAGGVGLAAVQIARRAGAEIFVTAGSAERRAFLEAQGLTRVYSSRTTDFVDAIRSATAGTGVDVVVNSLPGPLLTASLGLLAPYGRFVEIGRTDIARDAQLGLSPFARNLSFSALDLDRLARDRPGVVREVFAEVLAAFGAGELTPLPRRVFGVADVDQALEYMTARRHVGKIVIDYAPTAESGAGSPVPCVRHDATYLITGGLGGVGLAIAEWLVGHGARHLLLIGRRPPVAAAAAIVGRLEAAGARVAVRLADVASGTELAAVLDELRRTMPPLRGVVHAAGVIDDATLVQLDRDRLARVLTPKVVGAQNLHRMTLDDPLDVFVLCSSAASVLGSPGQGSYCAANAFMDALAHERRREGRPATAVNWGPWSDVGLAATADRSGRLAAYGINGLPPTSALAALELAFAGDEAQVVVLNADWARFRDAVGATAPVTSLVTELVPAETGTAARQVPAAPSAVAILATDRAQRPAMVTGYLQDRCGRVLGLTAGRLDTDRPLGAFGLDSLMAVQLKNHIERDLGVVVPIVTLVQGPSITQLCAQLLELLAGDSGSPSAPSPSASDGAFPLTPEQERIWLADRLDPGNPAFKVPVGIRLRGPLDVRILQRSLREVVLRHEALRTTFVEVDGVPMQVVGPASSSDASTFDVSHLPADEREAEAARIAIAEVQRPLDLATGPLFGAAIIRLDAERHVLVLAPHHIIGDGWSLAVLIGELATLYATFEQGRPSPLLAPARQFREFVRLHRLRQQQRQALDDVGYWRQTLADPPPLLDLPTDRPRPPFQRFLGTSVTRQIPADLVTRVDLLARTEHATRFMALLAALYILLERCSGQQDLVVGSPVAGRDYPGSEGVIGLVANVLALRADLSGDPTFRQLLARVRTLALDAYAHQDVPFRRVVEAVQPPRRTTYPPLFQVMLTNPPPLTVSRAGSLVLSPFEFGSGMAVFDLLLMVVEGPDGLSARLEGNADVFDAATVTGMLDAYAAILIRGACEPETRLSQFDLPAALASKVNSSAGPTPPALIAIASTFAVDPLGEVIAFWQDELALRARIEIAPFNQVFQQLLDPAGLLAANRSGANVLLVRAADWGDELDRNAGEFAQALAAAVSRSAVPHVVCACPPATRLPGGDGANRAARCAADRGDRRPARGPSHHCSAA